MRVRSVSSRPYDRPDPRTWFFFFFHHSVTARLPEYAALLKVVARLFLPAFLGQAIVVFTLLHVFTYIGMCVRRPASMWGRGLEWRAAARVHAHALPSSLFPFPCSPLQVLLRGPRVSLPGDLGHEDLPQQPVLPAELQHVPGGDDYFNYVDGGQQLQCHFRQFRPGTWRRRSGKGGAATAISTTINHQRRSFSVSHTHTPTHKQCR